MCQVEPLGRLGWSLYDLAVKNRNFSAHENSYNFLLESDIELILFADDYYTNSSGPTIYFRICGVPEVYVWYRLL